MISENNGNSTFINKISFGGSIGFIGEISSKVTQFLALLLLARYLGPTEFGLFTIAWAIVSVASTVGVVGLNKALIRFIPTFEREGDLPKLRGIIISVICITGGFSLVIFFILHSLSNIVAINIFGKPQLSSVIRVLSWLVPVYALVRVLSAIPQSFKKIWAQQLIQNMKNYTMLIFLGASILLGMNFIQTMLSMALAGSLALLLAFIIILHIIPFRLVGNISTDNPRLLRFSLPLLLSGVLYSLLYRIDQLILGVHVPPAEVGVYNAASILALQLSIVLIAVGAIFEPIVSDLYSAGKLTEMNSLFQDVTLWTLVITLPGVAILWLFPDILLSLFGAQFVAGSLILIVLTLHPLYRIGVGPTGELLSMTGYEDLLLLDTVLMLVLNIVLNIIFIPRFGAIGAAIATSSSIILIESVVLYQVRSRLGMNPLRNGYVIAVLLGSTLLIISFIIQWMSVDIVPRMLSAIIIFCVYAVVSWKVLFREGEKENIISIIKTIR